MPSQQSIDIAKSAGLPAEIIERMTKLADALKSEDFVGISRLNGRGEVNQGASHTPTFRPPPDLNGVEMLADLRSALATGDYHDAVTTYLALRRLLNW